MTKASYVDRHFSVLENCEAYLKYEQVRKVQTDHENNGRVFPQD